MTEDRREIGIQVPVLARVEGEGALDLRIRDGRIDQVLLRIYEPPRLFEKMLEGRGYQEVPDMVARICGICPVAYQMSAVRAIESVFGARVTPWIDAMRELFYCGEWIESHALHIHLLALPDFLGFDSVVGMAERHPAEVRRGLRLQGVGNDIIRFLGGRSVHPVGARVGGFHRAPDAAAARVLLAAVRAALPEAVALVRWCAGLKLPEDEQAFECVSVADGDRYPVMGERIVSSHGLDIPLSGFEDEFEERQVAHSTALHCLHRGQPYLVGPLARMNLHFERLPQAVRDLSREAGMQWPSRNLFHSLLARGLEMVFALGRAVELLEAHVPTQAPHVALAPRAGIGYGATEAPRGLLWHRYEIDGAGRVRKARIVPPTSQNQARIEQDLRASLMRFGLSRPDAELRQHAEMVIRNYDPCISCATHFLRLRVER